MTVQKLVPDRSGFPDPSHGWYQRPEHGSETVQPGRTAI